MKIEDNIEEDIDNIDNLLIEFKINDEDSIPLYVHNGNNMERKTMLIMIQTLEKIFWIILNITENIIE